MPARRRALPSEEKLRNPAMEDATSRPRNSTEIPVKQGCKPVIRGEWRVNQKNNTPPPPPRSHGSKIRVAQECAVLASICKILHDISVFSCACFSQAAAGFVPGFLLYWPTASTHSSRIQAAPSVCQYHEVMSTAICRDSTRRNQPSAVTHRISARMPRTRWLAWSPVTR